MADRGRPAAGLVGDEGRSITIEGMGDRGVSDAIGFVLVFGIIATTISVVYLAGFQSIDDVRQMERMNNAERAFDVFDDNMEDIILRGAPSRATEIKLADATLTAGEKVTINVTVTRSGAPSKNLTRNVTVDPIVFVASKNSKMVYSLGATFRQTDGAFMTNPPEMVLGDERLFIPVVKTDVGSQQSISGTTTVLIRTDLRTQATLVSNSTPSDVTVNISTPRASAWREYFREHSAATCDPAVNTATFVSCTFEDMNRVVVSYVFVKVYFRD